MRESPALSALKLWQKEIAVTLAVLAVLVGPFLLKPAQSTAPAVYDRRLVILTPHHDRIRTEFGQAFARYWKEKTGQVVFLDWRVPGGTAEIAMLIKSEFTAAFQRHFELAHGQPWTPDVAAWFMNPKTPPDAPARKAFLDSNVSIGVDLFFGGGSFDFQQQADMGTLVAQTNAGTGIASLMKKHPTWFSNAGIPEAVSGEPYRDPQGRWVGTCLSSFGIVFNRDVLRRLGITKDPKHWRDLADPRLFGQIALADPGRSASVTKAFEMLIQQQMQDALAVLKIAPGRRTPEQVNATGIRRGWDNGLSLIQRISANARYYTDASSKIPLDVARGDAAAGMCIDFYGRSTEEAVRQSDGTSRIGFVMPVGGTSVSVDPIGMFRGAPDAELATAFMEFVLSDAGQKLWSYKAGVPGGPEKVALRRLPVRKDLYTPANVGLMTDGAEMPYEKAQAFTYHPEWTAGAFSAIRFLIRVLCVDTHEEQQAAWRAIIDANQPERATKIFHDLNSVRYDTTFDYINKIVRSRDKIVETRYARKLGHTIRNNYRLSMKLAEQEH